MKLGVMQPYLFPYIGYFQLIREVDAFVIYDDVNYINGGWINRNYILANGKKSLITLPLKGASHTKHINQLEVGGPHKILKTLRHSYCKAPYFAYVFPIIEKIIEQTETNLASFLDFQLHCICDYIGLSPNWHISSMLGKDNSLRGQEKILAICEELGSTHYINASGGKELYQQQAFLKRGLQLSFILPKPVSYRQFGSGFTPGLSIIDVMMFNSQEEITRLLEEYDLCKN